MTRIKLRPDGTGLYVLSQKAKSSRHKRVKPSRDVTREGLQAALEAFIGEMRGAKPE